MLLRGPPTVLLAVLLAPALAGCLSSSGGGEGSSPWRLPAVGDRVTYGFDAGRMTATVAAVESIEDGGGHPHRTVRVDVEGPGARRLTAWLDFATGLPVRVRTEEDGGSRLDHADASMQWVVHQALFGPVPFLLGPFLQAGLGEGCRFREVYDGEVRTCGRKEGADLVVDLEFPQVGLVEAARDVRTTQVRLGPEGYPVSFGLLGLGNGFDSARLVEVVPGPGAPELWSVGLDVLPAPLHTESSPWIDRFAPGLGRGGLALEFPDALDAARRDPQAAAFLQSHPDAFVGAALYEPMPLPSWTIGFLEVAGEASYATTATRLDVRVVGASAAGAGAAQAVAAGELLEVPVAMYPLEFFGARGFATLDHAVREAVATYGTEAVLAYQVTLDPETFGTGREAVLRASDGGEAFVDHSAVSGWRLADVPAPAGSA